MKYLVTGCAGFIGSHMVDRLLAEGHKVVGIDNLSTGREENIAHHKEDPNFEFYKMDICDLPWNGPAGSFDSEDIAGIFHFAARARIQPSMEDPLGYDMANVHGLVNILEVARRRNVKIVFSSSSSVYGDQDQLPLFEDDEPRPKNPYALQKLIGEKYCQLFRDVYGMNYVALRYFNVYGERQIPDGAYSTVIGIFLNQFKTGQPFTIVDDGEQRRDFTYVKDVVDANLRSMQSDVSGQIINIGRGSNVSVNEVANAISPDHPRQTGIKRRKEARETLANNSKAQDLLGWSPTVDVVDWIKTQK